MQLHKPFGRFRLPFKVLMAGVVLVVLAYSAVIAAFIGSEHNTRGWLLLAVPVTLAIGIFTARYFALCVLMLPVAALAVPIDFSTGTESMLPISMLLTLGLTLMWGVSMFMRGWKLAPSPLNRPLIMFSVICIISLIWGILWRDPVLISWPKFPIVQVGALAAILLSICAALLIGNFVTTAGQHAYLMIIFIACCGLTTILKFFHLPLHLMNGLGLWALWVIAPAYGVLIAQPRLRWYWRALLLLLILLTIYQTMVVDSFWLSGWVPNIVAIYAITFLRSRKAFFVLLIIGAIVAYQSRGFFEQVAQDNIDDGSLERLSMWEQNWRVVREHWLLGTGPAGYAIYYMSYYRNSARSTHNNYIDILAQFGFSGMLAWLWLYVASLWEGWKLSRQAPPGILRTLTIVATGGWVGAMASMFFGDWVLPFAFNQTITGYKYTVYTWLFLGTLISVRQLLNSQVGVDGGQKAAVQ